jgi:hypothetical protein
MYVCFIEKSKAVEESVRTVGRRSVTRQVQSHRREGHRGGGSSQNSRISIDDNNNDIDNNSGNIFVIINCCCCYCCLFDGLIARFERAKEQDWQTAVQTRSNSSSIDSDAVYNIRRSIDASERTKTKIVFAVRENESAHQFSKGWTHFTTMRAIGRYVLHEQQ